MQSVNAASVSPGFSTVPMNFKGIGGIGGGGGCWRRSHRPGRHRRPAATPAAAAVPAAAGTGTGCARPRQHPARFACSASSLTFSSAGSISCATPRCSWPPVRRLPAIGAGSAWPIARATSDTPRAPRARRRGRRAASRARAVRRACVSVSIGCDPEVRGHLHDRRSGRDRARTPAKRDVFDDQKLRRRFEIVDEPADVAILAREHDRRRQLAELAVPLLRRLRCLCCAWLEVAVRRQLVDLRVDDAARRALVGRQDRARRTSSAPRPRTSCR